MKKIEGTHKVLIVTNITHEPFMTKCFTQRFGEEWEIQYIDIFVETNIVFKEYDLVIVWINYESLIQGFSFLFKDLFQNRRATVNEVVECCGGALRSLLNANAKNIMYVSFENFDNKKYYLMICL